MKIASIIILLISITTSVFAQNNKPYYDIIGNLSVNGEVTQSVLSQWHPYTLELTVPKEAAPSINGFDVGFAALSSVMEQVIQLDSIRITTCRYSLYHLDVLTEVETPVFDANGAPMVNINIQTFADETSNQPTFFTTPLSIQNVLGAATNSTNGVSVGTVVQNVGAIFSTKYHFVWGSSPDLTRPTLNQGYVIHFDISFVPIHLGVEYPEVKLAANQKSDLQFVYKVVDMQMPQFVSIENVYDPNPFSGDPNLHTEGVALRMTGQYLEYFKLQRSTDLQNWTDWDPDYIGLGSNWVGPFDVPVGDGGFYSNTFEWMLFDINYPNERRRPQKEFYRMVWTGRKGIWKIVQYP